MGRIYFGVVGALTVLVSLRNLLRPPYSTPGLALLAAAMICLVMPRRSIGVAGTILLAFGTWKLYPPPDNIPIALSFPASILFGLLTMTLINAAKQARLNKRIVI